MIILVNKKTLALIIAIILVVLSIITAVIIFTRSVNTALVMSPSEIIRPIDKGENTNYIAFACNVDWGNEVIPEMLRVLREKEVKITFFVTGRWVNEYPELFMSIVNDGHEIGSHGYNHLNYGTLNLKKNQEEIKRAEEIISKLTNVKPIYFAPPSGSYNENTLKAANSLGYKTILWTIDTIDWRKGSTSDVIINRVMTKDEHGGKIVLMHPMAETVKALPILIDSLREKGLEVGRVSDVLSN